MAALDYLAIQGSAVPCERVFSSAKETMTDRRNRIHEGLIIAYLESVLEAETTIPEDITAFIQSLLSTVQ